MLDAFASINSAQAMLDDEWARRHGFKLVTEAALRELWSGGVEDGWTRFRQRYPDAKGYTEFSRVGFSSSKTRAVVEVATTMGPRVASREVLFVERSARWARVASHLIAVS